MRETGVKQLHLYKGGCATADQQTWFTDTPELGMSCWRSPGMLTLTLNESWKDRTMLRAWVPVTSQDLMAQGGAAGRGCVHLSQTMAPGAGNELQDAGRGLFHLLGGAWAVMSPFL